MPKNEFSQHSGQVSILVVDDDADVRVFFRRVLEDCSCLVVDAASGRQALRLVEDNYFDVVLTDLSLPGIDGFVSTQTIRETLPSVRMIHTSGYTSDYYDTVTRRRGFQRSIDKTSIGPDALAMLVCGGVSWTQR